MSSDPSKGAITRKRVIVLPDKVTANHSIWSRAHMKNINRWLILFLTFAVPVAMSQTQKSATKKKAFSWKKYHAACGAGNDSREGNFEKIKGKSIMWRGTVGEVLKDPALEGNRMFAEKVIRVKMEPSDGLVADVKLKLRKSDEEKVNSYEKGDNILFKGKIMYLGTRLSDHTIEVEKFKKLKPTAP